MPAIASSIVHAPHLNGLMTGLRDILLGSSASPGSAWERMSNAVIQYGRDGAVLHAMAAIDIALWDIEAKRQGVSLSHLLGGPKRTQVRCYATCGLADTPEASATLAGSLTERGFTAVKFGWPPFGLDARQDVAIAQALRAAIGDDTELLLDAGMAWDVATAIERSHLLRPFRIHWLEEPLPAYDINAYVALRKAAGIPIAAGEMGASSAELSRLIISGAVDILQIDVSRTGLTVAMQLAALAARHDVAVVNHTYTYIVNSAASLHMMAAAPLVSLFECQAADNELRSGLDGQQLRPKDGWLEVPTEPGLGVHVDEERLEHIRLRLQ
jgi:L-alanine-DL-glutamate epimerase-like enolase superfamily enzyme